MKVEDIMTKKVICVGAETKITEVAKIISENRFHGVPVVADGKIIGIITEKDFFSRNSDSFFLPSYINFLKDNKTLSNLSGEQKKNVEKLMDSRAKDIMSNDCVSILKDMSVQNLLEFFKTTKYLTLPVIDENEKLVGIVTMADLIELIKV